MSSCSGLVKTAYCRESKTENCGQGDGGPRSTENCDEWRSVCPRCTEDDHKREIVHRGRVGECNDAKYVEAFEEGADLRRVKEVHIQLVLDLDRYEYDGFGWKPLA